ncbi:hypothetical protein [Flavobacterium wongokense]|uniref:hypothetical protein n=1 Tax=Flavobacterium wongokense TaxID=2910674 RepID=UPI001F3BF907|nr:hypothetical protein [Flavobacterium sp. WG47]MCF6132805.1 hypothetical protein [Flavobacterium sp. WG47]
MKSKFIQFGILAVLISNSVFANGLTNEKNDLTGIQLIVSDTTILTKPTLDPDSDTIVTLVAGYRKTMEEIIKEDNLIIESNITDEIYPLNIGSIYDADVDTIAMSYKKPVEEVIKEDNLIIESNITNEVSPLNFKSLNKKTSKPRKIIPSHCFLNKCCIKS